MAQTPEGARKAAKTNKKKDPDHYRKVGAMGGKQNKKGYFSRIGKRQLRKIASEGGKARAKKFKEAQK